MDLRDPIPQRDSLADSERSWRAEPVPTVGVAAAVGVTAFTEYVTTLAPGLIGIFDTPKFQFIGRVLGVAHNPGYPLYVMVSYLFSWVGLPGGVEPGVRSQARQGAHQGPGPHP